MDKSAIGGVSAHQRDVDYRVNYVSIIK